MCGWFARTDELLTWADVNSLDIIIDQLFSSVPEESL